jgi:hypothetical protein
VRFLSAPIAVLVDALSYAVSAVVIADHPHAGAADRAC